MQPFKKDSKIMISTNRTLNITGGSQRDRIIQFEVSDFFNENHSPMQQYGHMLIDDWNTEKEWENQWVLYDNFMCYCSMLFHQKGIIEPSTINLELRVLRDHTCQEFIEFMHEIGQNLININRPYESYQMPEKKDMFSTDVDYSMTNFAFEQKQLYLKFKEDNEDYKNANYFTQNLFTKWLKLYSKMKLGVAKPQMQRSNGKSYMLFRNEG